MLVIKSTKEVDALRAAEAHPKELLDAVERSINDAIKGFREAGWEWDPEEHGAFAIVGAADGAAELEAAGLNPETGLVGACWESCQIHTGAKAYEVLVLGGGDGGWTYFVPFDVGWEEPALRAKLNEEAVTPFWRQGAAAETGEVPF